MSDEEPPQPELPNGTNNNEKTNGTKIEQSDTKQEVRQFFFSVTLNR